MSSVFEMVKRTRKYQDLLLTQEAITSQQNLIWDYGTVAGERLLHSQHYGDISRGLSPVTLPEIVSFD